MKDSKVIALFGKSCVGKSEVAAKLAFKLSCAVRHCGDQVKARATQLGILASALSRAEHQAIDAETLCLAAKACDDIIMEGSFLDIVLANVPSATLIELTCEDDERKRRYACKAPRARLTLELRDEDDHKLRIELNRTIERTDSKPRVSERASINTTKLTSDEVVSLILELLGKKQ
jgi:cytidylate kinase